MSNRITNLKELRYQLAEVMDDIRNDKKVNLSKVNAFTKAAGVYVNSCKTEVIAIQHVKGLTSGIDFLDLKDDNFKKLE